MISNICKSEIRALCSSFGSGVRSFKSCLFGHPADYLKGRADRRGVERVLGIWAIRVSAEDARGTPRPSFERGWVGAPKSETSLKVLRWGCQ